MTSSRGKVPASGANGAVSRWTANKSRVRLVLLMGACLTAIGYAWFVYTGSPDYVMRRAISDLNSRNADGLVSLASERELHLLNLTPSSVQACLHSSYWTDSTAHPVLLIEGESSPWGDIRTYNLTVTGLSGDPSPHHFAVDVYQYNGNRWYVDLSELLYTLTKAASGKQGIDASRAWDAVARTAGITAVVTASFDTRYTNGSHSPRITLTHD